MSRQEQSHSDGPENNSCQKIEITGSKKMPYNHDYSEDVERRSDTMKHPINWVHMSTFDCLNKTKRHCSLINLIVIIISDWLTLADKALINVSPTRTNIVSEIIRIMDLSFDGYVHDLEIPFSQKKSGFRSYNQTGEWIQRQQISATYTT